MLKLEKNLFIILVIVFLLIAGNIFFSIKYILVRNNYNKNNAIKSFGKIFVEKVLAKEGVEVSYEDRLKLEEGVLMTENQKIIDQWHFLLETNSEANAKKEIVNLLYILFK